MMGLRVLFVALSFFFSISAHAGHQDSTVTVSGVGEVRVKPDTASVSVSRQCRNGPFRRGGDDQSLKGNGKYYRCRP